MWCQLVHNDVLSYCYQWTVIPTDYPDLAGFFWIVCGMADRIFTNYSTSLCTKSHVTAQLTVSISREYLPMKPVD